MPWRPPWTEREAIFAFEATPTHWCCGDRNVVLTTGELRQLSEEVFQRLYAENVRRFADGLQP